MVPMLATTWGIIEASLPPIIPDETVVTRSSCFFTTVVNPELETTVVRF